MKQIKFRGIDAQTGDTVYGYPVIYDEGMFTHWLYRPNEESNCPVTPESVAQLVTVIDGKEIYEGDTFERGGKKYAATLEAAYRDNSAGD